jgi:hypothetical protein
MRGAVALAAAGAALVASPDPAGADELSVDAGVDGFYDPGEHVVVRVTIKADRLLRGEVRVAAPNAGRTIVVRQPVEVPGGAEKTYLLSVPTSPFEGGRLGVELDPDGAEPLEREISLQAAPDTDLVGVLPSLAAAGGELPGSTSLAVDAGTARLSVLDATTLGLGADAIGSYDVIAGLAQDIDDLDDAARAALFDWLHHGGRLLLDDDVDPAALPTAWLPTAAGYAFAGTGEVRRTDGAASRGDWSSILEPASVATALHDPSISRAALENQIPPSATLARASGVDVPSIGLAVGIIVGYIAVVGPLLYAVLRVRRRLTLAWIAVPVVALLTAGLVTVTGSRLRTGVEPVAASVVETWPGGGRAMVNLLVTSRSGGETGAEMPDHWSLLRGEDFGSGRTMQVMGDRGSAALVALEPGQATMLSMSGPASLPGANDGLALTARSDKDGEATGTVRNTLDVTLTDVAVFVANSVVLVGELAPGAEQPWTVRGTDRFELVPLFPQVWGDADFGFGFGFGGNVAAAPASGNVDLGTWGLWASQRRSALRQSGLARAVGWTDELAQPVVATGGDEVEGRSAVTSVVPIQATGDHITDVTVRSSIVRAPSFIAGPVGDERVVVRYVLPPVTPAGSVSSLGLLVPRWVGGIEVWNGTEWVERDTGDGDADAWVPLPSGAVQDGTVHARVAIRFDREFIGTDLVLRSTPPDDAGPTDG